jgi:putative phosphoribosyl transferase
MIFESRADAGRKLGRELAERGCGADLVLGLPRGGVVVASEVAQVLGCPLDVLVVRKIGHPYFREFAVGALAEGDVVMLDRPVLERSEVNQDDLDAVIAEEKQRLREYQNKFIRPRHLERKDKKVTLVDDGLATGATMEAAVQSARRANARWLAVAVPVASTNGAARLQRVCDELHILIIDPDFHAVGQYYESFEQTTDEEVQALLAR